MNIYGSIKNNLNESLSSNSGSKKISDNIKVMNYKGTYIVLKNGHNEKEFDNEEDAIAYAKELVEPIKESEDIEKSFRDYCERKGYNFVSASDEECVYTDNEGNETHIHLQKDEQERPKVDTSNPKIKHYNLMGDDVILNTLDKTMTVNGKTFTFEKMNEFVKASRGANRIHKPMALLLYIDYKNGKLRNWESNLLNESTKNFTPALLDKYVENYNKSQKWIKGRRRPREKQPEDFEWRYMAGDIDGMKVRGEEETQIFDINTGEYLGPNSKYNSMRESSGDRYLITKHNRSSLAPYGIWDTKERKFVSRGEKGEYKNGVYEKSPLELELDKRNEKARQDKMKETEEDKPDEHLLDLLRTKDKIARDTDMPDDIAYNMMEKIDNEMVNAYSIEEIEKAEKYLGLE